MALELFYTSSPRGLRPGASGLCTVAMTRSMSAALAARLESLCGYRPPGEGTPIERWPPALSHWVIDVGGVERHVLASVRPVRPDHTMRSNTLAHFTVLHTSELDPAGAAWMLAQPETCATSWTGEPRLLDSERAVPRGGPTGVRRCATWQAVAGDAGWAGVLANAAMLDPSKPVTVIYPAGARVLDLVAEAMALLPAAYRWRVTFTTYFMQPVAGLRCTWRFCLDGTTSAAAARHSGGLVIDACAPQPCARSGAFIDAARTGTEPALAAAEQALQRAADLRERQAGGDASGHGTAPEQEATGRSARQLPTRRPVGIDEPLEAGHSGHRTALATAVVFAVVLLAVIAVLAVIMRSMDARARELDAQLTGAQQEIAALQGSGEEAARLREERDRLQRELGASIGEQQRLESAVREMEALIQDMRLRLQALEPALPPSPPQDRSGPSGGDPAGIPGDPASDGAVGPSAFGMPADAALRRRRPEERGHDVPRADAREDVVGGVSLPSIGALRDEAVRVAWPEAERCGISTVSLMPSPALERCGFALRDGATLAYGQGSSMVDVARVTIDGSAPIWTWLSGSVARIGPSLGSKGLRLPEDWSTILGQVRLTAMCDDGTQRVAVMAPPRSVVWRLAGKGGGRLEIEIPAALAVSPELGWGGTGMPISDGAEAVARHPADAGAIGARMSPRRPSDAVARVHLQWTPSQAEEAELQCIRDLDAKIAEERSLSALWGVVSQWHESMQPQQPALPVASGDLAQARLAFDEWCAARARDLASKSERDAFLGQPAERRLSEYRNWLWNLKVKPLRDELASRKAECDRASGQWRASMEGAIVTVRPERDSPPVAVVALAVDRKVPELPFIDSRPDRRGGQ